MREADKRLLATRRVVCSRNGKRKIDVVNASQRRNVRFVRAVRLLTAPDEVGTRSLLETFVADAERRTWFLFEAAQSVDR
jgi:hypothetical protein